MRSEATTEGAARRDEAKTQYEAQRKEQSEFIRFKEHYGLPKNAQLRGSLIEQWDAWLARASEAEKDRALRDKAIGENYDMLLQVQSKDAQIEQVKSAWDTAHQQAMENGQKIAERDAQIEALKAERDKWRDTYGAEKGDFKRMKMENAALRQEIERLMESLIRYGAHLEDCQLTPCTCKLETVLMDVADIKAELSDVEGKDV